MVFFKIIVPSYNNEFYIKKCLDSIKNQTFKDYEVVVIDDMSTDNSVEFIKKYPFNLVELKEKRYNGGTRNVGIDYPIESEYTLFLDSDDWFFDNDVLKNLHKHLKKNPVDCLSLSYYIVYPDYEELYPLERNDRKTLVWDACGACWTKCIRSKLIKKFPEGTLIEDTVQHINQCNYLNTFDSVKFPVVTYNRKNINALTSFETLLHPSLKWQTSLFRYVADLMELWCPDEDCEARRIERLETVKKQIKEGKVVPW